MSQKLSSRIVPELESGLQDLGLLTSLVTLDSPRFSGYLKKPANLLHDGWTYVEGDKPGCVFYRLGDEQGARQELEISRSTREAVLTTYQPKLGRTQKMVYSLASKEIVENSVFHDFGSHEVRHSFIFLNRREGRLSRVSEAIAA